MSPDFPTGFSDLRIMGYRSGQSTGRGAATLSPRKTPHANGERAVKRAALLSILLLLIAVGRVEAGTPRDILFGPYVNNVDQHSAKVLWVTAAEMDSAVHLLASPGGAADASGVEVRESAIEGRPEVLHTAALTGLSPGVAYQYVVSCRRDSVRGRFQTAPGTESRQAVRFVVYGDTRSHPDRHRQVAEAIKRELPLGFVLHVGDLVKDGTRWDDWRRDFFDPTWDLFSQTALWPVRGNHEKHAVLYRELFDLPGKEFYYSFDFGNLHIVVLDCYSHEDLADGRGPDRNLAGPEMLRWLKADLASSKAEWTVVGYHVPTFNIGGHGSTWGRDDVLPILEQHGVDVVVCGHSHLYERFKPIGPKGGKPIIHVVTGGGGATLRRTLPSPILAVAASKPHYCLFTVEGKRLTMQAKTPGGKVIDAFELVKSDGVYQRTIMAKAIATSDAVHLAFGDAARR